MAREHVHTYNFGLLNLNDTGTAIDGQLIYDSLLANVDSSVGDFYYLIADVDHLEAEGETFGYGVLVKYKEAYLGETVDESDKSVHDITVSKWVFAKSKFFIHYDSRTIAYRPDIRHLSDHLFKQVFAVLLRKGYLDTLSSAPQTTVNLSPEGQHKGDDSPMDPEVETLNEKMEIQKAIDELEIVQEVSYTVHPTNPGASDAFKKLDEKLKKLKAKKMSQRIVAADKGGLDKEEMKEDDIYQGIQMAATRYGHGTVKGIDKAGHLVQIHDRKSPITQTIFDSDLTLDLLNALVPTFRRVWDSINYAP